jgi:WD40 repeat protein
VTLWDAGNLKRLWAGGVARTGPTGVSFSPDGTFLAAARVEATDLLDPATGQSVGKNLSLPGGLAAAFSPAVADQGRYRIAVADRRMTTVTNWSQNVPTTTATFGSLKDPPPRFWEGEAGVAWAPAGTRLVFIPNSKNDPAGVQWYAQVWGGGGGAKEVALTHGPAPVTAVAWSPDGKYIATGCKKGDVVVWDAQTYQELAAPGSAGGRARASFMPSPSPRTGLGPVRPSRRATAARHSPRRSAWTRGRMPSGW